MGRYEAIFEVLSDAKTNYKSKQAYDENSKNEEIKLSFIKFIKLHNKNYQG